MSTESPLYKHVELPLCASSTLEHEMYLSIIVRVQYHAATLPQVALSVRGHCRRRSANISRCLQYFRVRKVRLDKRKLPFNARLTLRLIYLRAMKTGQLKCVSFRQKKFISDCNVSLRELEWIASDALFSLLVERDKSKRLRARLVDAENRLFT